MNGTISLKQQTVNGIKWLVGVSFLQKAISFGTTIILARLLGPSVFGLFAFALIIVTSFELFKSLGIDAALIRRQDDFERAANTAFIIIPILGTFLYIVLYLTAPIIGKSLNNYELVPIIRVLGIIFIFSCFSKVPATFLEKNMMFKKVAIADFICSIVFSISAIILAFLNLNIWAIVYAYIIKVLSHTILIWLFSRWRPRLQFDRNIALQMFAFGKFILFGSIVWFLKMNLDNLLVGKLLGVAVLGLYAIAFNIANFGADYFGDKLNKVMFPAFSKLQLDKYDLRHAFLKTIKFVGIFAFPLCVGLFLLGNELIKMMYGAKWIDAIPVLKVLVFAGLLNTLSIPMGSLFNATGNSKVGFWFSIIQIGFFILFIGPAAKFYGLIGIGLIVVMSQLVAIIAYLPFTKNLISLRMKDIYLCLKPGLISSVLMGFGIILLKYALPKCNIGIMFYYNLIALAIFAGAVYSFSLFKIEKRLLKEIRQMVF